MRVDHRILCVCFTHGKRGVFRGQMSNKFKNKFSRALRGQSITIAPVSLNPSCVTHTQRKFPGGANLGLEND